MAVMRHSIIFGGVDSADYGIYIGGEGVFNAPKREVEMIEIPGRNGAFALDKGRFENITVEYTAINHEPDLSTFSANLEAFRNALSAQKGYQRLTDTFHPDEYRMATLRDGLEIEPIEYNTASKFKIKFDCKPQRFLTSGDTAVTVSSGDTLTNPTLFEASPLIRLRGYGTLTINDEPIVIDSTPIGKIKISNPKTEQDGSLSVTLQTSNLNLGDSFYIKDADVWATFTRRSTAYTNIQAEVTSQTNCTGVISSGGIQRKLRFGKVEFEYGTASTVSASFASSLEYTYSGTSHTENLNFNAQVVYDGSDTVTVRLASITAGTPFTAGQRETSCGFIYADSTKPADNIIIYIDLDIGEAWTGTDEITPLNNVVQLPAKLPTLSTGENTIAYDNTLANVKVTPRWWKV